MENNNNIPNRVYYLAERFEDVDTKSDTKIPKNAQIKIDFHNSYPLITSSIYY